jgi:hypothetical protein
MRKDRVDSNIHSFSFHHFLCSDYCQKLATLLETELQRVVDVKNFK